VDGSSSTLAAGVAKLGADELAGVALPAGVAALAGSVALPAGVAALAGSVGLDAARVGTGAVVACAAGASVGSASSSPPPQPTSSTALNPSVARAENRRRF